jgi:hypothetical protein
VVSGSPTLITAAGTTLVGGGRYLLDATLAPFSQPLPAAPAAGAVLAVEAVTAVGKLVTVQGNGHLIEGQTNLTLGSKSSGAVYRAVALVYDGTFWRILDAVRNSFLHSQDYAGAGGGPVPLIPPPVDLTGTATIYIDSQAGSDAGAGTYLSPWKTLSHGVATAQGLKAGSIVALKCGSVFREALPCPISGEAASPITIGQYGTGPRPKIKGSLDFSNLTWTVYSGNIYKATTTGLAAAVVYVDEMTGLGKVSELAKLTAPGQFYISGTTEIYVWLPDGSSPAGHQIECSGSVSTICNGGAHNYWTIQDVAAMHSGTGIAGIYVNTTQLGWEIRRNQIGPIPGQGLSLYGATWAHDNYVVSCWDWLEYPNSSSAVPGIGVYGVTGTRVNNNRVTQCYYGIRSIKGGAGVPVIDHNLVYLNHVNGIDHNEATNEVKVYNNTVHHRATGVGAAGHGIDQQAGAEHIVGLNNIVYSDYPGTGTSGTGDVQALCFEAAAGSFDYALVYLTPEATAGEYPCYPGKYGTTGGISTGPAKNTGVYATWATFVAAIKAAMGSTNLEHAKYGEDPLFMDVANGDYRLQPGSPAIGAGVAITGVTNATGVNLGAL